MDVEKINQEQYFAIINRPHHGLVEQNKKFVFTADSLIEKALGVLSLYGVNDPYANGDYFLADDVPVSPRLDIEITNDEVVRKSLIENLQACLDSEHAEWQIHLRSMMFKWAILIDKKIRIYKSTPDLLHDLP